MTPTRADLERLIETWRERARALRCLREIDILRFNMAAEWGESFANQCADELSALLTSKEPAQRPETPTVGTWQPIETFKPGEHRSVLVYADGRVGEARYLREDDEWWWMSERQGEYWDSPIKVVTHWMPLPDTPTEPTPAHGGDRR